MANPNINIQDGYLFQSLKEHRMLDVALVTGKVFKDVTLKRFDRYAIILLAGKQEVLVYKHAIAVISDIAGAPPRTNSWIPRGRRPPGRAVRRW